MFYDEERHGVRIKLAPRPQIAVPQKNEREERAMKEKSRGLKESKKAPQKSLKEKRKLKKEKKNK